MKTEEYVNCDATELAALVKTKQVNATEVSEAAVSQIEKLNPSLNAVVSKFYDEIEVQLKNADPSAPFYGVPMLIKDLLSAYKGKTLTNSSLFTKDYRPDYDSVLVEKYKEAGFIILGQTNTPELGVLGITEPEFRGACRNPWSLQHSPGGSSGGSAVASGMVPVASGGDGGGSIRIPASACGLFGFKPSRGVTPFGPNLTESWLGLVSLHCLTKTVRDSAALLDIEMGSDVGAPYSSPRFRERFLSATKRNAKKLKIAFSTESILGSTMDLQCQKSVENAVAVLKDLGHEVFQFSPAFDKQKLRKAYMIIVSSSISESIRNTSELVGRNAKANDFEPTTWFLKQVGDSFTASELSWAISECRKLGQTLGRLHSKYDLFCTSTLASLPVEIGTFDLSPLERIVFQTIRQIDHKSILHGVLMQMAEKGFASMPNTQIFNLAGTPAMSVPLGFGFDPKSQTKLPIGVD